MHSLPTMYQAPPFRSASTPVGAGVRAPWISHWSPGKAVGHPNPGDLQDSVMTQYTQTIEQNGDPCPCLKSTCFFCMLDGGRPWNVSPLAQLFQGVPGFVRSTPSLPWAESQLWASHASRIARDTVQLPPKFYVHPFNILDFM